MQFFLLERRNNKEKNINSVIFICHTISQKRQPIIVSDHLPQEFQKHKKLLLPQFKKARNERKKNILEGVDGLYCLFIDNIKVESNV